MPANSRWDLIRRLRVNSEAPYARLGLVATEEAASDDDNLDLDTWPNSEGV